MLNIEKMLLVLAAYKAATGVPDTTVSNRVFGDTKRYRTLLEGGDLQTRRFDKALIWLSANWPAGAVWPKGVHRP